MWKRFRFTVFGKEVFAFEVDEELDFIELEDDSEEEEEEEEEEPLRWGEPCHFDRTVFGQLGLP